MVGRQKRYEVLLTQGAERDMQSLLANRLLGA